MKYIIQLTIFASICLLGSPARTALAQTLTTLYRFNTNVVTDGINPAAGLTRGTDGSFYGTTQSGGTNAG